MTKTIRHLKQLAILSITLTIMVVLSAACEDLEVADYNPEFRPVPTIERAPTVETAPTIAARTNHNAIRRIQTGTNRRKVRRLRTSTHRHPSRSLQTSPHTQTIRRLQRRKPLPNIPRKSNPQQRPKSRPVGHRTPRSRRRPSRPKRSPPNHRRLPSRPKPLAALTSPFCVSKRGTRQAQRDAGGSYTTKTPNTHHYTIIPHPSIAKILVQTTHLTFVQRMLYINNQGRQTGRP